MEDGEVYEPSEESELKQDEKRDHGELFDEEDEGLSIKPPPVPIKKRKHHHKVKEEKRKKHKKKRSRSIERKVGDLREKISTARKDKKVPRDVHHDDYKRGEWKRREDGGRHGYDRQRTSSKYQDRGVQMAGSDVRAEGRNDRESREQYPPSSGSSSWDTRRKEIDSGHLRDERVVDSDRVQYRKERSRYQTSGTEAHIRQVSSKVSVREVESSSSQHRRVEVRGRRERAPILIRRYDDEEVDSSRDRMRISDPGKYSKPPTSSKDMPRKVEYSDERRRREERERNSRNIQRPKVEKPVSPDFERNRVDPRKEPNMHDEVISMHSSDEELPESAENVANEEEDQEVPIVQATEEAQSEGSVSRESSAESNSEASADEEQVSSEEERGSAEDSGSEMGEKSTEEETASGEDSADPVKSKFDSPEKIEVDEEPNEESYEEDQDETHSDSDNQYIDESPIPSPEELKPELPYYLPAIQGCRSVDEFQCLNRIEEGTYGVVYRAKDKKNGDVVALKRLKMEKEREGFPITSLREVCTLLKAHHTNIVTVQEIVVGSNMDKIYIVMDYVEHDLKSLMESMKQPFLVGEVKTLMIQLLRGVHHLHDNWILHRDLKTSNLLLSHQGILKIGDFGLAREYGSPLKPYTPIVVTLWYRSPELLLGCKEYSTYVDLWSVGCIFAEFLRMKPLFPGKTEIMQLNLIFKELGTPNEKIWPGYNELPMVKKATFAEYPYNNLRKRFGTSITEKGFHLLNRFLTYCPAKRITAQQALQHEWFHETPVPVDPAMFPTWPAKSEQPRIKKIIESPKAPEGGMGYNNLLNEEERMVAGFQLTAPKHGISKHGVGFNLKF